MPDRQHERLLLADHEGEEGFLGPQHLLNRRELDGLGLGEAHHRADALHDGADRRTGAQPVEEGDEVGWVDDVEQTSDDDLDRPIWLCGALGFEQARVREIVSVLQRNYCGHIGFEYMHINDLEERRFIQDRIEGAEETIQFTPEGKQSILTKVIHAEQWEKFLAKKYVGTKRFGLDGGESAVPALEAVIKYGGQYGVEEIDVGMAHRGRLNILSNVMGKKAQAIFHEFAGGATNPADVGGSGDVKYHLGTSSDREFDGNQVHLSLTANPSHLEIVDPVVLGKVRANTMIDLAATSTKLRDRAARLVAEQLQCDYNDAVERLQSHDWNLRAAINSAK